MNEIERSEWNRLVFENWRIVRNAKRAKKIRARGDMIKYSPLVGGWIWTKQA